MTSHEPVKTASPAPAATFNDFLNRAVQRGALKIEHRRVRSRQPENETFLRKVMATVRRLVPDSVVAITSTELSGYSSAGRQELALAATDFLRSHPSLACYLGQPVVEGATPHEIDRVDLFCLLHAHAFGELSSKMGPAAAFGSSAATAAAALSGQTDSIAADVRDASDSVFAQSFADVHAVTLVSAVEGPRAATDLLNEVMRRRGSGGDFDAYSKAPLSHDTSASLQLLRGELQRRRDFGSMNRAEMWANSMWLASEGLGAWMQKHGTSARTAASISRALETAGHVVATAAERLSPYSRPAPRPI